jgi:hypothetical protein
MLLKASDAEGNVSDDELKRVRAIAFLLQYRRETHRLRNYERHGLLKVAGLQSRPPVRWE